MHVLKSEVGVTFDVPVTLPLSGQRIEAEVEVDYLPYAGGVILRGAWGKHTTLSLRDFLDADAMAQFEKQVQQYYMEFYHVGGLVWRA